MNNFYDPDKNSNLKYIYGADPGLLSGFITASVLWSLGYPDQATLKSQKMLTASRLINHSFSLVTSLALDSNRNSNSRNY